MPPAFAGHFSAMSRPRAATNATASSKDSTPQQTAAANSPQGGGDQVFKKVVPKERVEITLRGHEHVSIEYI